MTPKTAETFSSWWGAFNESGDVQVANEVNIDRYFNIRVMNEKFYVNSRELDSLFIEQEFFAK